MLELEAQDLGLRKLGLFLAIQSLSQAEPNSPEGRAKVVLEGLETNYKAFISFMQKDVDANYLLSAPAREPIVGQALQELEKRLNNGREILKSDVIGPRDRLKAEIEIKRPEFSKESAAQAVREEGWLAFLERRSGTGEGSHLERQKLALEALQGGDELGYRAILNAGPVRLRWLFGEEEYFAKYEQQWLQSKVNPLKKERLASLNRLVATCEEAFTKTMGLARERAKQPASPEQQMRERLEADRNQREAS